MTQQRGKAWTTLVEMLAEEFSARIRQSLSADELAEVRHRNAEETDSRICHTGDFVDSNQIMLDAVAALGMAELGLRFSFDTVEGQERCDHDSPMDLLSNEAWDLAKRREFYDADTAEIIALEREIGEERLEEIEGIVEEDRRIKESDRREFLQTIAFRLKAEPEATAEEIAEEWMDWQDGSDDSWE